MSPEKRKHLWEYEHPYYMTEGCFFKSGMVESYESFDDFLDSWGDNDVDLNRVHRWDWDHEGGLLNLFYVIQRKGYTYSVHVRVKESDEPKVRKFLKPHAELNATLWEGIL